MTEMQPARSCLAIVLAAGEGTRMKSRGPKVLHAVAGRSLLGHALAAVSKAGADAVAVVISSERPEVGEAARKQLPHVQIAIQHERLGTAHAALAAKAAIAAGHDDVIIAFGDTPLVRPETFAALRRGLREGAAVVALGSRSWKRSAATTPRANSISPMRSRSRASAGSTPSRCGRPKARSRASTTASSSPPWKRISSGANASP